MGGEVNPVIKLAEEERRKFESPRGRRFLHPVDVSLDVPPPESPLVSALEPSQAPTPSQVVHDIGTEIEQDRQIARLEDSRYTPAVQ